MARRTVARRNAAANFTAGRVTGRVIVVKANRAIGSRIQRGDEVFIDLMGKPKRGQYIIGKQGNLVPWTGQRFNNGVAVRAQRDL